MRKAPSVIRAPKGQGRKVRSRLEPKRLTDLLQLPSRLSKVHESAASDAAFGDVALIPATRTRVRLQRMISEASGSGEGPVAQQIECIAGAKSFNTLQELWGVKRGVPSRARELSSGFEAPILAPSRDGILWQGVLVPFIRPRQCTCRTCGRGMLRKAPRYLFGVLDVSQVHVALRQRLACGPCRKWEPVTDDDVRAHFAARGVHAVSASGLGSGKGGRHTCWHTAGFIACLYESFMRCHSFDAVREDYLQKLFTRSIAHGCSSLLFSYHASFTPASLTLTQYLQFNPAFAPAAAPPLGRNPRHSIGFPAWGARPADSGAATGSSR